MGVVIVACVLSLVALCSGILAIGSGARWQFRTSDIRKGRKNALLYVWVTFSTMFSLAHTAACIQYALLPTWGTGPGIQMWFSLHATIGLLLTSAHLFIHRIMKVDGDRPLYLWGPGR
jgi:hypothetical protein